MQGDPKFPLLRWFPQIPDPQTMNTLIHKIAVCALVASAGAGHAQSAKRAAYSLPDKYREGIIKIAGEASGRDPEEWAFVCRANHSSEGIVEINVKNGKISRQQASPGWRVPLGSNAPIALERVLVDSRGAHEIARRYVADKGLQLGSTKLTLEQADPTSDPVWSVWCFNGEGSYIGLMKLLAPTGDVIFFE